MKTRSNLVDSYGRRVRKLRFSLNEACNMRCMYCMPPGQSYCFDNNFLSAQEIRHIVKNLVDFGIEEVRLTGGEPLLRKDFTAIAGELSNIGLKKLGLTTNAVMLEKLLPDLKKTELTHINISLDSLDPAVFRRITNLNSLHKTLRSIEKALNLGFRVKLNTVMLKGVNDEEVSSFMDFAAETGVETRFLELMRIGAANEYHSKRFISASEIISKISRDWDLSPLNDAPDSTSFNFRAAKNGKEAVVGFIASESRPFCGSCSRLRITSRGELRPCIMLDAGPSLRGARPEDYEKILREIIEQKPLRRLERYQAGMNKIGG